jgi:hypothetical protein
MPNQAISPAAGLSADQIDRILNQMADSFGQQLRSPIWHSPSEASLDYEDVTFPSLVGVPLEGWFILSTSRFAKPGGREFSPRSYREIRTWCCQLTTKLGRPFYGAGRPPSGSSAH